MIEQTAAQLAPYVAWSSFALAFVFGAVGNKTNFCTLGAVSDWLNMGDLNRMRMWLLAIGVAILGANGLHLAGVIDLSKSIYQGPNFTWLSYVVGGFLFGVGMTLGSGCGSKTLIRIGVERFRAQVIRCGEQSAAKGTVSLAVVVKPDGVVQSVTVSATPDAALGECAAGVMRKATFAKTQSGGSFTYPFVF